MKLNLLWIGPVALGLSWGPRGTAAVDARPASRLPALRLIAFRRWVTTLAGLGAASTILAAAPAQVTFTDTWKDARAYA
jgi:hypothetical protein